MGIHSPVQNLPLHLQVVGWLALTALTIGYAAFLKSQGAPLAPTLPLGIVSLEVPWSGKVAAELVEALKSNGLLDVARRQVQLDFVFLVLYPLCLAWGCFLLAGATGPQLAVYGLMAGWAVLLCGPLDAVENFAMLQMLQDRTTAPWPHLSTVCASVKFALVFGATFFGLIGFAAFGMRCVQKVC